MYFHVMYHRRIYISYSKNKKGKIYNILFFEEHNFYIRNLTRLGYNRSKKNQIYLFVTCFHTFTTTNALANHNKNCELDLKQNITPAPKGTT